MSRLMLVAVLLMCMKEEWVAAKRQMIMFIV